MALRVYLQRHLSVAIPVVLLTSGAASQVYMLYFGLTLATDTSLVRYVVSNEFMLTWVALASIPLQWSSMHIATKAHSRGPAVISGGNTARINWLPVDARLLIIMWSGYVVVSLAFAACTSFLIYQLQLRSGFFIIVLTYAMPIAASVLALPPLAKKLLGRLRNKREREQDPLDTFASTQIASPANTILVSNVLGHTKISASTSLPSEMSQSTRCSPKVVGAIQDNHSCLHRGEPHEFFDPFSPISNGQLQFIEDSMVTMSKNQTQQRIETRSVGMAETIARTILRVIAYSPFAVLTALCSIVIYVMIFSSALEQYRHLRAMPTDIPILAESSVVYADGARRPVYLSISCKGALTPELNAQSANGPPQQATILIEHMSGFPSLVVRSIQDALADQNRRVCIYDRPGYMLSPQGYAPISLGAMEKALGIALSSIGERGPYYLVGHHSGSENAQMFLRENELSVVGMAFLYPTYASLLGLMSAAANSTKRGSIATSMTGNNMIAENTYSATTLNIQRMLTAIGVRSDNSLTGASTDTNNQIITDWALENTHLAQAQYYEHLQRQRIIDELQATDVGVAYMPKKLPVMLLGIDTNGTTYDQFLDYVDDRYKVEMPNVNESQPLMTARVARQIIWHISRIS